MFSIFTSKIYTKRIHKGVLWQNLLVLTTYQLLWNAEVSISFSKDYTFFNNLQKSANGSTRKDKVDEVTLALLYLVMHDEDEYGAKAWKGFDWDTMNRLHERGFIGNPVGKTKSVVVTPEGCNRAKKLFKKHFVKQSR